MIKTKILLFDIDGTLLLTGGAGRIAFERIFFEKFGKLEAWKQIIPDGKTDPLIISELAEKNLGRLLSEKEYQHIYDQYEVYFKEELPRSDNFRVMPGIPDLLGKLSQKENFILGISTGNFENQAWLKLEQAGFRDYFKFGGFGSDSENRKELTRLAFERAKSYIPSGSSVSEIYVIGDTVHDVAAGKAIGAKTIAVATGRTTPSELYEAGSDWVFKDFSDPEQVLECFLA